MEDDNHAELLQVVEYGRYRVGVVDEPTRRA